MTQANKGQRMLWELFKLASDGQPPKIHYNTLMGLRFFHWPDEWPEYWEGPRRGRVHFEWPGPLQDVGAKLASEGYTVVDYDIACLVTANSDGIDDTGLPRIQTTMCFLSHL